MSPLLSTTGTDIYLPPPPPHTHMHTQIMPFLYLECRLREVDHFQNVLEHSAFIEDPMSAINEHINNSVVKCVL